MRTVVNRSRRRVCMGDGLVASARSTGKMIKVVVSRIEPPRGEIVWFGGTTGGVNTIGRVMTEPRERRNHKGRGVNPGDEGDGNPRHNDRSRAA